MPPQLSLYLVLTQCTGIEITWLEVSGGPPSLQGSVVSWIHRELAMNVYYLKRHHLNLMPSNVQQPLIPHPSAATHCSIYIATAYCIMKRINMNKYKKK